MRKALTASLATVGLTLSVYLATLAPGLPPGHDSGEFATVAALTGIAHPPGYPLFSLLSAPFAWLGVGALCWRLNAMVALFVSLAAGGVAFATALCWKRPVASFLGSSCAAFGVTTWAQAVAVEKYALHLLLLSLWVVWAALWQEREPASRGPGLALVGGLVCGLALTYHYTSFLVLPGLVLFLACERPERWDPRALVGLAAGCSPVLFLPLRAAQDPGLNWGDPSTGEKFVRVLLRQGYGGAQMGTQSTGGLAWNQLGEYFSSLFWDQYPPLLALLILLGFWRLFKQRDALAGLLAVGWLALGPGLALLAAQPEPEIYWDILQRLLSASYLLSGGLVVYGLVALPQRLSWIVGAVGLVAALALHAPRVSLAGQYHLEDTSRSILARLPQESVMVTTSDLMSGALLFRQKVRDERPDVTLVFPGLLSSEWYRSSLPTALRQADTTEALIAAANLSGRSVYWETVPSGTEGVFVPMGLVYHHLPPGSDLPPRAPVDQDAFSFLEAQPRRGDYRERLGRPLLERSLIMAWANAYRTVVPSLTGADRVRAARRVVEFQPHGVDDWLELAQSLRSVGELNSAQEALLTAYSLDPGRQATLDALKDLFAQQGRSDQELLSTLRALGSE